MLTDSEFFCLTSDGHEGHVTPISMPPPVSTEVNMLSADLKDSVAAEIGRSIPEVQAVFATMKDRCVLHVWAIVPTFDRAVYRSIYAREKIIIERFQGMDFDFNVVPSNGRDPRTMISDPGIELAFLRS